MLEGEIPKENVLIVGEWKIIILKRIVVFFLIEFIKLTDTQMRK